MSDHNISLDTQATLLLCGSLGQKRTTFPRPLKLAEYNHLAQWLREQKMRPADLLDGKGVENLRSLKAKKIDVERIIALFHRGGALAVSVEIWANKGLWVISRGDESYPARLKLHLKRLAPPILYGSGSKGLLNDGGLAIVGSRNIDEEGLYFANRVAILCAQQGIQVISGGARGVDREAMLAALDEGGHVIGVMANGLAQAAVSKRYRDAIRAKNLVLISPFDPDAGFNVGNAMGRNKYIYALSNWALAVNATTNKGGTWTGAIEGLKHKWVSLFIRSGDDVPEGNKRLISMGGIPMESAIMNREIDLNAWLKQSSDQFFTSKNQQTAKQLVLFSK